MKKIKLFLNKLLVKIGNDGLLHLIISFGLVSILSNYMNIGLSLFISVLIGFLKEIIWDGWMKKGQFQWKDLLCDLVGSLLAFLLLLPTLFI